MKRALIAVISTTAFALALSPAIAQAHDGGGWGDGQQSNTVPVVGTVVSTDPTSGSFVANVCVLPGDGNHWGWGHGRHHGHGFGRNFDTPGNGTLPTPTQVTITTDSSTSLKVDGQDATVSDLVTGQKFVALFTGTRTDPLSTLVSSPALSVYARTPHAQRQLYAFVGTVTAVDTTDTPNTVTVQVAQSFPSGLVGTADNPATFTVSDSTMILGGSSTSGLFGGTLSDVSVGDTVAGGVVGTAGETLAQVEASPLQALVDFPTGSSSTGGGTSTTASTRTARTTALRQALALFGYRAPASGHGRNTRGQTGSRRGRSHSHGHHH